MSFAFRSFFKAYANISPIEDEEIKSVHNPLNEKEQSTDLKMIDESLQIQHQVSCAKQVLITPKYILDPESMYVHTWDIVVLFALVFTALVTPYEVALLATELNALFYVNRVIDCIFIKDMIMNFFMPYWEQNDIEEAGLWIRDLSKIKKKYLKGWFCIDLVSILPFDLIAFFEKSDSLSTLKIVRIIRVLRLLKLVRVVRASRIFKRLENEITLSFSFQSLIKFTAMVLIGGHWLACIWALVGYIELENEDDNWITAMLDTNADGEINESEEVAHFEIFTASLYFAIMTITSIGYGDITPQSLSERWVCICIMFCGSAVWAYIIGNASGIVATMDVDGIQYHQTMDNLNIFLKGQRYPKDLNRKLRSYFRAIRHLMKTRRYQLLVQDMSPKLRDVVAVRGAHWVKKVPWSKGISTEFVAVLVQRMEGAVFAPDEVMPSVNHLCVVNRGVASKQGHVLVKGNSYGMDIVLQSTFLKQKTPARALTFTELLFIKRSRFLEVLARFPIDAKLIRRYALSLAIRRAMILIYTFSKCGWKFSVGDTVIPYVAPQTMNQGIGEKYEKFVRGLNPNFSGEVTETNIEELIRSTEKQEHEQGDIAKLLGHSTLKSTSEFDHTKLDKELHVLELKVNNINSQVLRCERALDLLLEDVELQMHSPNRKQNLKTHCSLEVEEQMKLSSAANIMDEPPFNGTTVNEHLNLDRLRGSCSKSKSKVF